MGSNHPNLVTAAEEVLRLTKRPMTCRELVLESLKLGLVKKCGATPQNTLSASLNRNIANKGIASPFIKVDRGRYGLNPLNR